MSHKIQVAGGKNNVLLPNGGLYNAGAIITLTDDQYSLIPSSLFPNVLVDIDTKMLFYTERANVSTTTNLPGSAIDVPGLVAINVPVGDNPIMISLDAAGLNSTAGSGIFVALVEAAPGDTNRTPILMARSGISSTANGVVNLNFRRRLVPASGNHTYKIQFSALTAGTGIMYCGIAGESPWSLKIEEEL
jgi:hypothetical protein